MRFHFLILLLTGPPLFRGHSHLLLETNLWGEASPRVSETSLSLGGMYNCTNQCHSWWDPPGTHACTHSCIWACDVPEVVCETKENRWLKESLKENCWRKMEGMRWVGGILWEWLPSLAKWLTGSRGMHGHAGPLKSSKYLYSSSGLPT